MILYYWQGRDSSTDEKGASALLASQLDEEMGGFPTQVCNHNGFNQGLDAGSLGAKQRA